MQSNYRTLNTTKWMESQIQGKLWIILFEITIIYHSSLTRPPVSLCFQTLCRVNPRYSGIRFLLLASSRKLILDYYY